ncbi:putative ABC transport system permease protein [Pedobacter sp. UYEF25]
MLTNYIKIAWRNLFRNKVFNAVNILGLAAGLSSFIVILLYQNYELSYDKWSPKLQTVYKVSLFQKGDYSPQTPAPLAQFLADNYRDAEAATSMQGGSDYEALMDANNKKIYQKGFISVDSSFLKVFPFELVRGNILTALNKPDAAVISEKLAKKLFGSTDPIGQTIKVFNAVTGTITAVMKTPKTPTHFTAELLMRDPYAKQNNFWGNYSYHTYIKLKQPIADAKFENDINRIYYKERLKEGTQSFENYKKSAQHTFLYSEAVSEIHNFPKHGESNFKTVSILLILAILLLLAGTINFSNLAIAKSIARAKEVGVRKVLGSGKKQLIFQFMTETFLQCLLSLIIACLVVFLSLNIINNRFDLSLSFWNQIHTTFIVLQIAVSLFLVAILSGLYPALVVSRFDTVKVLKGSYGNGSKNHLFRNGLIVLQFMVSAFFIMSAFVIKKQMNYMQNKDKGFSSVQVMRIEAPQKLREQEFPTLQNLLLAIPGVSELAKTTTVPGDSKELSDTSTYGFNYAGNKFRMTSVKVSTDYFTTLGIKLKAGRLFNDSYNDQNTRSAIINESAFLKMHDASLIGKTISFNECDSVPLKVVGVVSDFNVQGFDSGIQPAVYTIGNKACMFQSGGGILVKINSTHMQNTVTAIEQAWRKLDSDSPIRYSFLDDNFQKLFLSYSRLQSLITFFALIAVVISIMGLFSLTVFFTKQRNKEIGIRKVLGASVTQLVMLLSKDFALIVLLSVLLTIPFGLWAMNYWLNSFVYRIAIEWWFFAVGGGLVLSIALITVSFQAIKAALANPVKSLRSE